MLVRDERDKVLKICYCGSMAEQLTRNEQVVGSIPTSSSRSIPNVFRWGFLILTVYGQIIRIMLYYKAEHMQQRVTMMRIVIDISNTPFPEQIKLVRMSLQLTQEELARQMGVSYATVSRWERENRKPQLATLGKLYSFCQRNGIELVSQTDEEQVEGVMKWVSHTV